MGSSRDAIVGTTRPLGVTNGRAFFESVPMLHAIRDDGTKGAPRFSGAVGVCPYCQSPVRGKCGHIVTPHWAHDSVECDPWSEPETEWHRRWKERFLNYEFQIEVQVTRNGQMHRADGVLADQTVVEFQHSAIPTRGLWERESFYRRMFWIFDVRDSIDAGRLEVRDRGSHHTFRWKHPKKHIAFARQPVYLDLGNDDLFLLKKMHVDAPCGGYGELLQIDDVFPY